MSAPTDMNEISEHGMEDSTSTTVVNQLLQPLCTVSSRDGQLDFLRLLRKRIADPSDVLAERIRKDPLTRQELAVAILQRVVHASPSSSSQHSVQSILLDCCGASCVLEAALRLIRDDKDVDDTKSRSFLGVESSLNVVAWIFIRQPDVLCQLLREVTTDSAGPTSGFSGRRVSDANDVLSSVNTSFLQTWTHQVVLLSRVIANRCNRQVGHFRLPNWAVASNWEALLVECALTATCNHHCNESSLPSHYLKCLLTCLLSRTGGGSENAALGIYRTWIKVNGAKKGVPSPASGTRPSQEVVNILQHFPHTQVAQYCRAMLLLALARHPVADTSDFPGSERVAEEFPLPGWLLDCCLPLLATSEMVQDRFVQETLLSHSLVVPQVVSGIATLLHLACEEPVPSASSIPDEGDDSCTSDDEESCSDVEFPNQTSSSTSGPLLRQVHRIAPLWSSSLLQSCLPHAQPCQRQQRLLTVFVRKSFELLSCSETSATIDRKIIVLDASSDTVLLLMQGVSNRLQSSNPDIRRDGMIIGEVLGKHVLNQPIIFDELHSDDMKEVGVTTADAKNQSCIPQTVSRKVRVRPSKGRIRDLQTDPDALYVSDSDPSEDGSNRSVESDGQYSDDSEVDDDEGAYLQGNYNVEDDELDLRVAGVPLYLQECLDLLRTPETDEVVHAKHQAALEALPKLIRARPGDLQDFGSVLAKQLVGMENNFSIEGFDDKLLEPLCALLVEEPLMVGQALVDDLFHRDGSLYNRSLTLTAMEEASLELSGAHSLGRSANPEYVILYPSCSIQLFRH